MDEKVEANPIIHQWKDGILTTQDDKLFYYNFKNSKLELTFKHSSPISFVTTNEKTNFVVLSYEKKITVYLVEEKEFKVIFERYSFLFFFFYKNKFSKKFYKKKFDLFNI